MTSQVRRSVVPPALAGERIDKVIPLLFESTSRGLARRLLDAGAVRVDGKRVRTASRPVAAGERLELAVDAGAMEARDEAPVVLDAGRGWVVVGKRPGQHVQGTAGGDTGTVLRAVERWVRGPEAPRGGEGAWLVHRLDADASGAVLVATTPTAARELSQRVREGRVGRVYLALVAGIPTAAQGSVALPLAKAVGGRVRVSEGPEGRSARTDYAVLATYPAEGWALLRCTLHTGRTHQIRVHMADAVAPIVGDRLYGSGGERLRLHAWRLSFEVPDRRRRIEIVCPPGAGFWRGA